MNGALYISTPQMLSEKSEMNASFSTQIAGERVGFQLIEGEKSLEIDTEDDFQTAEIIAQESPLAHN